jgi:uncharacterized protein YjbJ (UPF0337 family)
MSTSRKFAHRVEAAKGRVKMAFGRLTGNRRLRAKGRRDQVKGKTKLAGSKVKDAARRGAGGRR